MMFYSNRTQNVSWISYLFPWIPFFAIYKYSLLIMITMVMVSLLVNGKININGYKPFIAFLISIVCLHFFNVPFHLENSSWLTNFIVCTCMYGVAIITLPNCIDKEKMIRSYYYAGIVAIAGLIYHCILVYIFGISVETIVVFPKLLEANAIVSVKLMRPMSFFSEPQAYISFIIPLFIITLYKKNYIYSIVIAISILLSTSSTGILVVAGITFIWLFRYVKNIKYKIALVMVFTVGVYCFFTLDIFSYGLNKISHINFQKHTRIYNGFALFNTLPLRDKIFGISGGNSAHYFMGEYSSSFSKMLIEYGYVGTSALIAWLFSLFRVKNEIVHLLIIYVIVVMFGQTILFNTWYVYTFVILYVFLKNDYISKGDLAKW